MGVILTKCEYLYGSAVYMGVLLNIQQCYLLHEIVLVITEGVQLARNLQPKPKASASVLLLVVVVCSLAYLFLPVSGYRGRFIVPVSFSLVTTSISS